MEKLTERDILSIVDGEFSSSMGAPDGDIAAERAEAWRFYNSEPFGNEIAGKSSVVTSDVSDVVDGILPSLLKMFTTQENLLTFDAVGAEDEELAAQETEYTSYMFFKKNEDAFLTLHSWFFDALTQKNGIVKAWWDNSEVITEETYTGLTEQEVFSLLADDELEPIERSEEIGETIINGQIVETTLHDIQFKRTTTKKTICVDPVPPEEYRISSDSTSVNPSKARMVGQERDIPRSDLLAMGFDANIVDDLPEAGKTRDGEEEIARRSFDEERAGNPDKSQQLITVRECYIKLDLNGDGKSELRQVFTSNGKLLSNEPADRQPFHVLTSKPLPHKHFGTCPAEMVMDIQKITSTLTRQMLDNLYQTNNPRNAVYEQAIGENTMDDLLSTEIGGNVRFDRPVGESWSPMTVPFTAGAAFPMLDHWDKTKRDRTGVSSDSEGLSPDQLKNIQQGVLSQVLDMSRDKIELIARIFAETGLKSLFIHMHELIRKHQDKVEVAKLRNQWIEVDPASWRNRHDVTVNIGLGIGSRESNLIHLNAVSEKQQQMIANGGMGLTVTPQNIYQTAKEFAKNANLKNPDLYFTNPGDQQSPPQNQEQMQLQQQALAQNERQQQLDADKSAFNREKLQFEREKALAAHEREMLKISNDKEADDDDVMIAIEKLQKDYAELEAKYADAQPDMIFDPAMGFVSNA